MEAKRVVDYELEIGACKADTFFVTDFVAREAVNGEHEVVVNASLAKEALPGKLLGKRGTFKITLGDDEAPRTFHGFVVEVRRRREGAVHVAVQVRLASPFALLDLGRDHRLFPEADARAVIDDVLEKAAIPGGLEAHWSLKKDLPKQLHILQRDESDGAFVRRLLARDGLAYVWRDEADGQTLAFFDDSEDLPDIAGDPVLTDRQLSADGNDAVFDLHEEVAVRPDAIMLRTYDPLFPSNDLDGKVPLDKKGAHELYLHPGDYSEKGVGQRWAERRLAAANVDKRVVAGRSNCPRLAAGLHVTLDGHPRAALNGRVLLREIIHRGNVRRDDSGRQFSYENEFKAAPEKTPLPPPPPVVVPRGGEIAFVTCPPGEEIHIDEVGRIKVRFPWDRSGHTDDKSSGWLRVGQLPLSGSMILPRGGFEVLIDYELGETDRPAIVGHLYNGTSLPPYPLPAGATISSIQSATTSGGGGANEIRFEDSAGGEEIFLNASKDLTLSVDNDAAFAVAKNESSKVGSNCELNVGTDFTARVVANRTLNVGASQSVNVTGDYHETIGGAETLAVGGLRKVQCGGDHAEASTGTLTRTVAALMSVTGIKGVGRHVVGSSSVTAGAAWIETVGRSRGSDVAGSRTETVAALKLVKAKQMSVTVQANLTVTAAAQIVKCGGSRTDNGDGALTVTTGGGLKAKAKNVTIEAKQSLVLLLGGCMFRLSKGGKIVVKAPQVVLTGTKELGQIQHASN